MYLIDPTVILCEAILEDERALSRLQSWWDEELYDLRGEFVRQTRAERVESVREWFYAEATDFIKFDKTYLAAIFDAVTDEDVIDWDQVERNLYSGGEDE